MANSTRRTVLLLVIAIEVFVVVTVAVPLLGGKSDSQTPWALGLGIVFIIVSAILYRLTPKDPPKDSQGSPKGQPHDSVRPTDSQDPLGPKSPRDSRESAETRNDRSE